jgi:hypothetical protein
MCNQNQSQDRTRTQSTYASRLLHPVGLEMPSQTVHFTEDLYRYLITTKTEEQSMSDRVRELVEAGRETEGTHE